MSWGVGGGGADYDCAVVRASFPVIVMSRMRFYRKLVCFSAHDGPRGGGAAGGGIIPMYLTPANGVSCPVIMFNQTAITSPHKFPRPPQL